MSKRKRIGIGHVLGAIVDLGVLAIAVFLFRLHWLLGTIGVLVFFGLTCGFMPGVMFRELDEEPDPTPPHKHKVSPYADLVGTEGKVVAELKPQGLVRVRDHRISAKSDLGFVANGTMVKIVEAKTNAVVVEPIEET